MKKRTKLALMVSTAAVGTALAALALRVDSTLALLREGYEFIPNRSRRYRSDVFDTRLLLRKAVCMTGEEAAKAFYYPDRVTRNGALPPTTLRLLQDLGSVQSLDGAPHRHRKRMFMPLMGPESTQRLGDRVADHWRASREKWKTLERFVLFDEVEEILCRAACDWIGVPLRESEVGARTREIRAMLEGAGAAGPRVLWGLRLRERTEQWLRGAVEKVRSGELEVAEERAAHVIAWHRDAEGQVLDTRAAAVELLNLLRPIVAVARLVTFAALALHEHPEARQGFRSATRRYKRRWKIERLFAYLGSFRRLVVRYERSAQNFLGFVQLGCIKLLLRRF